MAASVLRKRVQNAEAARLAAEEALQEALDRESEMRQTLRELEDRRSAASSAAEVLVEETEGGEEAGGDVPPQG